LLGQPHKTSGVSTLLLPPLLSLLLPLLLLLLLLVLSLLLPTLHLLLHSPSTQPQHQQQTH
jgi:hypothetical protein